MIFILVFIYNIPYSKNAFNAVSMVTVLATSPTSINHHYYLSRSVEAFLMS